MDKGHGRRYQVYVGTYAEENTPGIYHYIVEAEGTQCQLKLVNTVSGIANPSFLEVDKDHDVLFAVSETGEGTVVSYAIQAGEGALKQVSVQSTHGGSPCHVTLNSSARYLVCANYTGGSVALFPVAEGGQLGAATDVAHHTGQGVNADRQSSPHPHSAMLDPTGRFALVPDLGIDRIVIYEVQENPLRFVRHSEAPLMAGAGPRHFAFHPSGRYGYVMNELNSTVTAFAYDEEQGALRELQTVSALPEGFTGDSMAADIHISPSGRYLYGSNRGHDSIVVFAVDAASGRLTLVQHESTHGSYPRNFALTPDGEYLLVANQGSDSITTFTVDGNSGKLRYTGHVTEVPRPTCIRVC